MSDLGTAPLAGIHRVTPAPGMITLRGDFTTDAIGKAAVAAGGVNLPDPGRINTEGARGLAWMSPDELLVLAPPEEVPARLADLQSAFQGAHAMAVNVSGARAVFEITGPAAREVMAKLVPVDLHPDHFTPGLFRRTRLAQVAAAFWMPQADTFRVICFRSVAQYVQDVLAVAAQPGSDVGHFTLPG